MKDNKNNIFCSMIIALSIILGSSWIGYSLQKTTVSEYAYLNKALITQKEAANYLSMNPEIFDKLILEDSIERSKYTVYDTYAYLPYVYINTDRYFNPELLDLWAEYNSVNHSRFKTK